MCLPGRIKVTKAARSWCGFTVADSGQVGARELQDHSLPNKALEVSQSSQTCAYRPMVDGEVLVEDVWTKWVFATCLPMANSKATDALSSRPDMAGFELQYRFAPFTLLEVSLDDPEGKTS